MWAALGGVGSALGLIVGGLLTAGPGWRRIFFINLPIGLIVLVLLPLISSPAARENPTGAFLPTTGGLLQRRTVQGGMAAMLIATGLLVGSFFLGSIALQRGFGWSALVTGLAFLPMALGTLAGAHAGGRGIAHLGSRRLAVAAFGLAGLGLATASVAGQPVFLIAGLTLASVGIGSAFVTAGVTSLSAIEPETAGIASALLSTAHEIGGAATVGLLTAFIGGTLGLAFFGLAVLGFVGGAALLLLMPSIRPQAGAARFVH